MVMMQRPTEYLLVASSRLSIYSAVSQVRDDIAFWFSHIVIDQAGSDKDFYALVTTAICAPHTVTHFLDIGTLCQIHTDQQR